MKNIIAVVSVLLLSIANLVTGLVGKGVYDSSRLLPFMMWVIVLSFVATGLNILLYYIFYFILNKILNFTQSKGDFVQLSLIELFGFYITQLIRNLLPETGTVSEIVIYSLFKVILILIMLGIIKRKYNADFKVLTEKQKIKFGVWIAVKLLILG